MRIVTIAVLAVVGGAACGDGTSPPAALSGTYTLQTIDGQAPPRLAYAMTGEEVYVVGGSLSLSGNAATFTQLRRRHAVAPNAEQWSDLPPRTFTLTFTRSGNDLTIATVSEAVPAAGLAFALSEGGTKATLQFPIEPIQYDGNHVFVFRRD